LLFPTFTFACFFMVVLVVHWSIHHRPVAWRLFILAASYIFYGYWNWRFIFLLAGSTVVNQVLAVAVHRAATESAQRLLVGTAIAVNLLILGFFKYYDFFAQSLRDTFGRVGLPAPPLLEIILPVGVSFFTFQALSYVLDVRRGQLRPVALLDFAVYLAFFPHLVAGPIVRASEFLPQLRGLGRRRRVDLTRAVCLIGAGLFKKVVISSYLSSTIVDPVFANPGRHSALDVLFGIYGYAIQIFADFSGYTDIAIGLALLLGFQFPQNFDRPYSAVSIQDFWRRWHMTLSRWLRDYLYVGLGGNRDGPSRRDRNLFLTMLLGGLWHGAAWTFVIWGALQGAGLLVERRVWERRPELQPTTVGASSAGTLGPTPYTVRRQQWIGRLYTFHFICLGWVFFRAPSIGRAGDVLARLVIGWGRPSTVSLVLVLTIAAALAVQYVPKELPARAVTLASNLPIGLLAVGFGLLLLVVDLLGPDGVAPFIYFRF
jgi:D-alanyl-lipoteichoic acid acyltransferase DltB (MBOAT superfamily)